MRASAIGESIKVNRLIAAAAMKKATRTDDEQHERIRFGEKQMPRSRARIALIQRPVNQRLKSIAAVRAQTMQTSNQTAKIRNDGQPFAATTSAPSANGSAKIVCEKRISRRNRDYPSADSNLLP